ncbi:hypothetical protein C1H46_005530 [Malus baccata]|uniref:Aminotransferase class I/classII large domain-containing protein n=1 Tax=Malus baccata TaxID=106549 RepID=A0A540ND09_MALBA|nr:hypothetical protein C1H46_005530 [Malus baccata]
MQNKFTWPSHEMRLGPSTFLNFSKHFCADFNFIRTGRPSSAPCPSFSAAMSAVPTQNDVVSGQTESTQKTQQPLQVAKRLEKFKTTIFTQMSNLAIKHGAINLGQGFPNFDGPEFVKEAAIQAVIDGKNQYARGYGVPDLNNAIAERFKKDTGLVVDPEKEITVTSGCTEAIAATMLGLINPGDEVILFAPFYDSYEATLSMAGAKVKGITLRPPEVAGPIDELRSTISKSTRAIVRAYSNHEFVGENILIDWVEDRLGYSSTTPDMGSSAGTLLSHICDLHSNAMGSCNRSQSSRLLLCGAEKRLPGKEGDFGRGIEICRLQSVSIKWYLLCGC